MLVTLPPLVVDQITAKIGRFVSNRLARGRGRCPKWLCISEDRAQPLLVKCLPSPHFREANVYRQVLPLITVPRPRLLLIVEDTSAKVYWLVIEFIPGTSPAFPSQISRVLQTLASLHDVTFNVHDLSLPVLREPVTRLTYMYRCATESIAQVSSLSLGRCTEIAKRVLERSHEFSNIHWLSRSANTLVHGNVHSGNVILDASCLGTRAFLIDWADSDIGSPLEDLGDVLCEWPCSVELILSDYRPSSIRRDIVNAESLLRAARFRAYLSLGWLASRVLEGSLQAAHKFSDVGGLMGL